MRANYLVTEENLIGSVATAMLKLKRIKDKVEPKERLSDFIGLIKFIEDANNSDYKKLLYKENFFISESVLRNLHTELNKNNISSQIDFTDLIETLSKIVETAISEDIDTAAIKLNKVAEILLHIKVKNQTYM